MEELQALIGVVAGLPTMTVWVLAGYLAYRLAVVGSIYGVIRLCIVKLHDWKVSPPPKQVIEYKVSGKAINEDTLRLLEIQVSRLGDRGYIHSSDVDKLRNALDQVIAKEVK